MMHFPLYSFVDVDGYKFVGVNKKCEDYVSEYTYIEGTTCNGWGEITFKECKAHCDNNETPIGCPTKSNMCNYVIYYTDKVFSRRCFLASELCKPVEWGSDRGIEMYEKKREFS